MSSPTVTQIITRLIKSFHLENIIYSRKSAAVGTREKSGMRGRLKRSKS